MPSDNGKGPISVFVQEKPYVVTKKKSAANKE